jgi:hypothetical protein
MLQPLAILPQSSDAGSDKLVWPGNVKGNFTVTATYQMMCGHSNINASVVWGRIWNLERLLTNLEGAARQWKTFYMCCETVH